MAFSGAVKIADLDDFLTPAQACVKPLLQPKLIKSTERATATVSLSDCLSCSGCVTSAETVLLQEQSLSKVAAALETGEVVVSLSEQSVASFAHAHSVSLQSALGKLKSLLRSKGVCEVLTMQNARDLCLRAAVDEFLERHQAGVPVICSECPGWVCFAEKKADPEVLRMLSTVKSPLLAQDFLVRTAHPSCSHVCVLPCYDKKLEAHRVEKGPIVLTTRELEEWVQDLPWDSAEELPAEEVSTPGFQCVSSHGYAETIFVHAALRLFNRQCSASDIAWKTGPKRDWSVPSIQELTLTSPSGEVQLRFLLASGFQNIQNLVRTLKRTPTLYNYVELMACPMGCLNGAGQLQVANTRVEVPYLLETLKRTQDCSSLGVASSEVPRSALTAQWAGVDRPPSLRW